MEFAVWHLETRWATPALRELAGESADPRRCHRAGLEVLWTQVVPELGEVRCEEWGRASVVHARHVLRLYRARRLDECAATCLLRDMASPRLLSGPLDDELRDMGYRHHALVWAEEDAEEDPDAAAAAERARVRVALHALEDLVSSLFAATPATSWATHPAW